MLVGPGSRSCSCCSTGLSLLESLGLSGHASLHTAQLSLGAFSSLSHMSPSSSPHSHLFPQGTPRNASVLGPAFIPRTVLVWS